MILRHAERGRDLALFQEGLEAIRGAVAADGSLRPALLAEERALEDLRGSGR
jgi:hypothetical protein